MLYFSSLCSGHLFCVNRVVRLRNALARLILCGMAASIALSCGLGEEGEAPLVDEPIAAPFVSSAPPSIAPPMRFVEGAAGAGIDFVHETGAFGEKWMPETMGSGCVLFDYDGDLDLDLLLLNGRWWSGHSQDGPVPTQRFYRNRGDGTFEDRTREVGLDIELYGMGATAGDYDGDGDIDLYLTALGDNLLLRNDGGRFVDVTMAAGVAGQHWRDSAGQEQPEWSSGAVFFDADGDGWIDLFVVNYVRWSPATDLFTTVDGVNKSYATPQQYDGASARFYRNRGDGTFAERTREAGLWAPQGKSLGVAVADFDDDGWPDLFVANDTQPDFLYRNRGDGTFAEVGLAAGIAYDEAGRARAGMGVDVAALDNDRVPFIAVGNFSREPVSLHRQARALVFVDEAARRGVAQPTLSSLTFGLLFADFDLDGYQDLALANGHIEPTVQKVQKEISYAQLPQIFCNDRAGGFVVADSSLAALAVVGRGLAQGDIDGDGDVDLLLTSNGGPVQLLYNESAVGNAVRVLLRGAAPNTQALGAKVTAMAGDLEQRRWVRTGSSYLSQSELALTFGLGVRSEIERLVIDWPSGQRETLEHLVAGFTYVVVEGKGVIERVSFASE
jgi:hypothetical protein